MDESRSVEQQPGKLWKRTLRQGDQLGIYHKSRKWGSDSCRRHGGGQNKNVRRLAGKELTVFDE